MVRGENYLLKMVEDTNFMGNMTEMAREFGFDFGKKNPFSLPVVYTSMGSGGDNGGDGGSGGKGLGRKRVVVKEEKATMFELLVARIKEAVSGGGGGGKHSPRRVMSPKSRGGGGDGGGGGSSNGIMTAEEYKMVTMVVALCEVSEEEKVKMVENQNLLMEEQTR